jgi:hypothetical protein
LACLFIHIGADTFSTNGGRRPRLETDCARKLDGISFEG